MRIYKLFVEANVLERYIRKIDILTNMFWFFRKKDSDFNRKLESMNSMLKNSFDSIKNDMGLISQWINAFNKKHKEHDEKFERILSRLERLEEKLEKKHDLSSVNEQRSIVHERVQSFKRSNQSFTNVQSLDNLKERLTPAQKRIIQVLDMAEMPIEYEDIARELGISIVTVRRHVNDIKKMGFQIKEKINVDAKRKVFYLEKDIKRAIKAIKHRK